jgi:hypothetical protein
MTTKYFQLRDINGYNGFGLPFSDTNYSVTLTASTDTTLTVPSAIGLGQQGPSTKAQSIAIISVKPNGSVWMAVNATAAVPAGNTFASTTSELIGPFNYAKLVNGGDVLHFISPDTGDTVSVSFYSLS